jgi:hypothetical protein
MIRLSAKRAIALSIEITNWMLEDYDIYPGTVYHIWHDADEGVLKFSSSPVEYETIVALKWPEEVV